MKKIISVALSVLIMLSLFTTAIAAEESKREYTEYPVICVAGYGATAMYRIDEKGNKVHVWGVDGNEILQTVLAHIAELGVDLGALTLGNAKMIADTVGREFVNLFYDLACNNDGSTIYDLKKYCSTVEECCFANLESIYGDESYQYEPEILGEYKDYIGKENIFNFTCDFRMGAVECARVLDEFVQEVKAYTGKSKVNIFAVSHGGQISATYLSLYGEKGDVNNAVLTIPAIGGAALAYDIISDNVKLDEYGLLRYIEHGMMHETDYDWLVRAEQLGFLDDVCHYLVPYFKQVLLNWGSIWDFIPAPYYEGLKKDLLDPVANKLLIEKSDYMHNVIMTSFAQNFKKAQNAGTDIFIIAGYDNKSVTGLEESSDAIITINSSTGATPSPFGKRFADGYKQKVDTGFYQVSPSMTLDASTAYLPKHTFFVENFYHGMTYKDAYTAELLKTLLLTEEIKDVHTNPSFPQFHATTNISHSVFASFNKSTEGYVSSEDTKLVVRNLSEKFPMKIMSVEARGIDISFSSVLSRIILPGKSIELSIKGDIPKVSLKNFDIVIDYTLIGSLTPLGERTLNFTVMNGEAVKYDAKNPFVVADLSGGLDTIIDEGTSSILKKTGLKDLFEIIYNIYTAFSIFAAKVSEILP